MVPDSMGFPHLGQFMWMSSLLMKTKTPLSHQRDKGVNLCGTTLLAGPIRPATQVLPGNGGGRRGLLSVQPSAPRGCRPSPPVRLAPNGGSLRVSEAGTCPFPRGLALCAPYLIRFFSGCQGKSGGAGAKRGKRTSSTKLQGNLIGIFRKIWYTGATTTAGHSGG